MTSANCLARLALLSLLISVQLIAGGAHAQTPAYKEYGGTPPAFKSSQDELADSADPEVKKGAYLARAGDCIACHSAVGGLPYAGGLGLHTPFGVIYSTNITPDKQHGIGDYTYDDFVKAVRQGVAKDGRHLYPAMPYPSYSKVTDEDMHALYAYFSKGVAPAETSNKPDGLKFPFNIREVMAGWNLLYRPSGVYQFEPKQSEAWNRGAYLVQGLAHCGACHTPHGVAEQEKADDEKHNRLFLSGYTLAGWHASNLRSDQGDGLGRWSVDDLMYFFRAGRNAHTAAFGVMTEAVGDSTQYLTDEDLRAMAIYLKSLPTREKDARPSVAATAPLGNALAEGRIDSPGALVYLNNCNACHRSNGQGAPGVFPELAGNSAVLSDDPTSLIHIVLSGSHMASTALAPAPLGMPDFGWRLSDEEIAQVLSFARKSWGNQASMVSENEVKRVRTSLPKMSPSE